jgi:glycosyltransferase involved in cell wall biosynthesis
MRILHITSSIGRKSFGVGQVAVNLTKAQNELNALARIWCLDPADEIDSEIAGPALDKDKVNTFSTFGPARLGFSYAMLSAAGLAGGKYDVAHQHGIWTACSLVSNKLRRLHQIPIVIAPHGSLEKWALRRSRRKKNLALMAYERVNLHKAACFQALSEAEACDFRDYGITNPIAVIPNGVSELWLESCGDGPRFCQQYNIPAGSRILLFLSRITPKKGLPLLLGAIDSIRISFSGWLLLIAGADEFGHLHEIRSLVKKLKLQDTVRFIAPLYDQEKRDAFAAADAFVLPSYSEGAPMVILESLATGLPVLTTQATPWKSLAVQKCGWWVEASTDGLAQALKSILGLSREELKAMGQRGRELARSQYLWKTQGQKCLDLYGWLLRQRAKPDFVITDK